MVSRKVAQLMLLQVPGLQVGGQIDVWTREPGFPLVHDFGPAHPVTIETFCCYFMKQRRRRKKAKVKRDLEKEMSRKC